MWEKVRIDGKKKLKYKAIPTIFGELVYQVEEKIDKEPTTSIASKGEVIILHMDPITKEVQLQSTIKNREKCVVKAKINRGLLSQTRSTNIKQNDESPEEYSDDELMQKKRAFMS